MTTKEQKYIEGLLYRCGLNNVEELVIKISNVLLLEHQLKTSRKEIAALNSLIKLSAQRIRTLQTELKYEKNLSWSTTLGMEKAAKELHKMIECAAYDNLKSFCFSLVKNSCNAENGRKLSLDYVNGYNECLENIIIHIDVFKDDVLKKLNIEGII